MEETLPQQKKSSINPDGSRAKIIIADVAGYFTKARTLVFFLLIAIYAVIPLLKIAGHPVILIDILHRRFYLFGHTFNAQDFYLVFFLISGVAFLLFYLTALLGRVWCGWACPQTVFLEGVFRKIERFVEGPKASQILLAKQSWGGRKIIKFLTKHGLYLLAALFVSHIFLSYFVSLDQLAIFVTQDPREHWVAFLWMASITFIIYINFAWFREQLCLIVCPYGRIQSTLTDDDTLVIGYDERRGEPRGKKKDPKRGDCIDCRRCIDVCPTGIDIRNGLQLECVGCANCIDACDEIMAKIDQSRGLIRYDSLNGFNQKPKRILRPRIYLYTLLLIIGLAVSSGFLFFRKPFEANLLRMKGSPYLLTEDKIRNQFLIHLINKTPEPATFRIVVKHPVGFSFVLPLSEVDLKSLESKELPLFIEADKALYQKQTPIEIEVTNLATGNQVASQAQFLGP